MRNADMRGRMSPHASEVFRRLMTLNRRDGRIFFRRTRVTFILRLVCKSESRGKVELGQCPATSAPTDLQTNLKRSRLWPRHEVLHAF